MAIRISESYIAFSVVWGLLLFLQLQSVNLRYPLPLYVAVGLMASGACFGVAIASVNANRWLASLEKKGEVRTSWWTMLIVVGTALVFSAILFMLVIVFRLPNEFFTGIFNFAAAFTPAFFAMHAYLFRTWERRHKKFIMQRLWSSRAYVYPYP